MTSELGTRPSRFHFGGAERGRQGKALILGIVMMLACAQDGKSQGSTEAAATAPACSRPGQVWWNELLTLDTEGLAKFYADVIGWTIKSTDPGNTKLPASTAEDRYIMFTDGSQEMAGLIKSGHPEAVYGGLGWFVYIHVLDVDTAINRVQQKGGRVLKSTITTTEGDRIAVVSDPIGNVFGLVTPANTGCPH